MAQPKQITLKTCLISEIQRQLEELDTKLNVEIKISDYVQLLSQKRQLQSLLNHVINERI